MYVNGDWNAKVGKQNTAGVTGNFGLGTRNERGDTMVDFCSRNSIVVMNTMFKQYARRLYTRKSPDNITRNQIDYMIYNLYIIYRSMEKLFKKSNTYPWNRLWHISQFFNSHCHDKSQTN